MGPAREPWPPAHRAYAPEGTEEKPIYFKKNGLCKGLAFYRRDAINCIEKLLISTFQ